MQDEQSGSSCCDPLPALPQLPKAEVRGGEEAAGRAGARRFQHNGHQGRTKQTKNHPRMALMTRRRGVGLVCRVRGGLQPPLLFKPRGNEVRTIVYVDGFNLYYGAVKETPHKWLDILKLCQLLLPKKQIVKIKYFTALVTQSRITKVRHLCKVCSPRGFSSQPVFTPLEGYYRGFPQTFALVIV